MSNFLDIRCPKCRATDQIDIAATVWLRVMEDGTDADQSADGNHEFEPTSPATCNACGFAGQVRDFEQQESEIAAAFGSDTPKKEDTITKLEITERTDTCVILAVDYRGRHWEIDVRADFDEDGGIIADIGRDGVLCTSAEFGWRDKHDNEKQD
jgi:hypothetical protein